MSWGGRQIAGAGHGHALCCGMMGGGRTLRFAAGQICGLIFPGVFFIPLALAAGNSAPTVKGKIPAAAKPAPTGIVDRRAALLKKKLPDKGKTLKLNKRLNQDKKTTKNKQPNQEICTTGEGASE